MLPVLVVLALAELTLTRAAITPNVFFNVTYSATSPYIVYGKNVLMQTFSNATDNPANSAPGNSWVTWYDNRALANYTVGESGWGIAHNDAHGKGSIDDPDPPSLMVSFAGTDMYLWGDCKVTPTPELPMPIMFNFNSLTANTTPDAVPGDDSTKLLNSATGFDYENQQAIVTVYGGDIRIDGVTITTGIMDTGNTTTRTAQYDDLVASIGRTEPFVKNNQLNPFYEFSGNWTIRNRIGNTRPVSTHDHAIGTSLASVTVTVPQNSSFVLLTGTVGPENGLISTKWNVKPSSVKYPVFQTYNPYESVESIFMATLDPTVQYQVEIIGDAPGNNNSVFGTYKLGVSNMVFLGATNATTVIDNNNGTSNGTDNSGANSNSGGASKKSNHSALIGGVVGGVGGALLLALLAFLFFRWRRNAQRQKYEEPAKFEVDDSQAVTSPFSGNNEAKNSLLSPGVGAANHSAFLKDDPHSNPPPAVDVKNLARGGFVATALSPGASSDPSTSFPSTPIGQGGSVTGSSSTATAPSSAPNNPKARPLQPTQTQVPVPQPPPPPPPAPMPRHFAQEEDGGTLPVVNDVELIPPSYREEWSNAGHAPNSASLNAPSGQRDV